MAISEAVGISDSPNIDAADADEKPRTLFVGNVPKEVHKREIEEIFGEIGPLKRCYIQYPRVGNEKRKQREDTTVAYVTFALPQDATKALETLQSTKIGDNKINIKFAKARSEQSRTPFGDNGRRAFGRTNPNFEPVGGVVAPKPKEPRPKPIKKKSRLIVRNLSFSVTEEKLKEYFEKFGEIKDVNILKKPNGKLVGCAFIQYQNIFQASKALKELNLKPFLGRPIAIDWALPKAKYQTEDEKNRKRNENEGEEEETVVIKDEPEEDSKDFNPDDHYEHLKEEPMDIVEIKEESDDEKPLKVQKEKKQEKRKRNNRHDDESNEEEDDSDSDERKFSPKKMQRKGPNSNDVEQGKTLFLRNLSFDTTEEELKEFFEQFGELEYGLLCKDKLTEHPKGTGFVKFKEKMAADKCLEKYEEDAEEFKLNRRQFNVSVALPREKIEANAQDKQEKKADVKPKSDSRNLYLAREGFVRPGSGAAEGVSASDMNKRAALNKVKKQMLKNLNILISPTRLCVHNLPEKYSDNDLRKLFKKHGGPGAKITEAKIMRDMNEIQLDGKGKSKGYGFVNFTEHEHALKALRSVNNNPTVFTANSRPIVEFSMENRLALKAKEKRALRSKEKNPNNPTKSLKKRSVEENSDEDEENVMEINENSQTKSRAGKKNKKVEGLVKKKTLEGPEETESNEVDIPDYAGLVGKKGVQTLPSFKPKGKITRNSLKQKKSKKEKKIQERRQREGKTASKRPVERIDKTEKIIAKHQRKLNSTTGEPKKKKKWYE